MNPPTPIKPSFFEQCAASAQQLESIAKLQPLLEQIYRIHRAQMKLGAPAISAATHREICNALMSYITGEGK